MPKVIDGLISTGDVSTATKITAPTITLSTSPTAGYFWKCNNASGTGEWAAVSEEIGMIFPNQASVAANTTLSTTHGVVVVTGLADGTQKITLPELASADYYGRVYLVINADPTYDVTVECNANDTIDATGTTTVTLPKAGSKICLVGGGSADHRWYTV